MKEVTLEMQMQWLNGEIKHAENVAQVLGTKESYQDLNCMKAIRNTLQTEYLLGKVSESFETEGEEKMKSFVEIGMVIFNKGWTIEALAHALCLSEFTINYAIRNDSEVNIRKQIAGKIGVDYEELFGCETFLQQQN